jgi:hypothetical protein
MTSMVLCSLSRDSRVLRNYWKSLISNLARIYKEKWISSICLIIQIRTSQNIWSSIKKIIKLFWNKSEMSTLILIFHKQRELNSLRKWGNLVRHWREETNFGEKFTISFSKLISRLRHNLLISFGKSRNLVWNQVENITNRRQLNQSDKLKT